MLNTKTKLGKNRMIWGGVICGLMLTCASMAFGDTVTAVGMGTNRSMAIEQAKRNAVEQGVGALIDSSTKVENFTVLQDKIYSRASGYVTSFNVLSEGKSPTGEYTVTIQATVQTASIKDDLRAIGILLQQTGNYRFMAVYLPETRSSMYRDSRVVKAAEQAINGEFARGGFVVLDKTFVNNVYAEIEQAGRIDIDMDDLAALALKYQADVLLVYDVHAAKKTGGQSQYFGGVLVEIALRAVAPATADMIAQKAGDLYVKTMKMEGNYYDDMQAAQAADALGKGIAKALMGDVLQYLERSVHAGARMDVWFRNFSEEETYVIADVIEAMNGYKDMNVRQQTPGNFQLDVNYQGKKFDFQRELFQGLKAQGIRFQTQQSKGNRYLLFKEGTDNPFREEAMNIR